MSNDKVNEKMRTYYYPDGKIRFVEVHGAIKAEVVAGGIHRVENEKEVHIIQPGWRNLIITKADGTVEEEEPNDDGQD